MDVTFVSGSQDIQAKLDNPLIASSKGIIFLPGISGGALSDQWDSLAKKVTGKGYNFLRFKSRGYYNNDLENFALTQLHEDLTKAISFLRNRGISKIAVIAKSFGGVIALTYRSVFIKALVLWSPTIGIEKEGNVEKYFDIPFKEWGDFTKVTVDKLLLLSLNIPSVIIHGTMDDVVSLENSKALREGMFAVTELYAVQGVGHQFNKKQEEVNKLSLDFISKYL